VYDSILNLCFYTFNGCEDSYREEFVGVATEYINSFETRISDSVIVREEVKNVEDNCNELSFHLVRVRYSGSGSHIYSGCLKDSKPSFKKTL
jgi:hypothetical protein